MTSKLKVTQVTVRLDDGATATFDCSGVLSISRNARKAGGYRNAQEWDEYHITWVEYKEEKQPRQDQPVEVPTGPRAEDFLNDPNFMGIEHGVPKFRKQQTQYNFDDFGLDDIFGGDNGV